MGVFSHIISWDALADSRVRWDDLAERRMEQALKPIHRLSQIWGQTEHRDSGPPGYATRNKIHRIMVEGPNGAAYSGPASPAKWGVEMEIFEHCFQLLPEYEYQQRFLSHYVDMPGSHPAAARRMHLLKHYSNVKCGSDDAYQRGINAVRRALLKQYTDILGRLRPH